jgi:hypothetical protein
MKKLQKNASRKYNNLKFATAWHTKCRTSSSLNRTKKKLFLYFVKKERCLRSFCWKPYQSYLNVISLFLFCYDFSTEGEKRQFAQKREKKLFLSILCMFLLQSYFFCRVPSIRTQKGENILGQSYQLSPRKRAEQRKALI